MSQEIEFITNNSTLVFAFVAIIAGLAWTFIAGRARGVSRLGPVQATQLINSEDAVVIDVRAESEFRQGHIINAVNVPESEIASQGKALEKYKSDTVITVCSTGQISTKAAAALKQLGFEKVHMLTGGLNAWHAASLPLSKK